MIEYVFIFFFLVLIGEAKVTKQVRFISIFLVFSLFSGLRYGIGYDYFGYLSSIQEQNVDNVEYIPKKIMFLSKNNCFLFFIITSLFTSFFYIKGIYLNRSSNANIVISSVFYFIFPCFFFDGLSIIRQAMACSLIFYSYIRYQNCKIKRLILILIASLCHISALAAIITLLPIEKLNKNILFSIGVSSFLFGSFLVPFFIELSTNYYLSSVNYYINNAEIFQGGSIMKYLINFIYIALFCKYNSINKFNSSWQYLFTLLTIGIALFNFFSFSPHLAMRMFEVFGSVTIILIPDLIKAMKINRYLYFFLCACFLVTTVAFSHKHSTRIDNKGYSHIYPYRTIIWQK